MSTQSSLALIPLLQAAEIRGLIIGGDIPADQTGDVRRIVDDILSEDPSGRTVALFSEDFRLGAGHETGLWRSEAFYRMLDSRALKRDDILVLTNLRSEREELLLRGLRGCFVPSFDASSLTDALRKSLELYLIGDNGDGTSVARLEDPIHYMYLVGRRQAALSERQFALSLTRGTPPARAYQEIANTLLGTTMTSVLEPQLKALYMDNQLRSSSPGYAPLADLMASYIDPSTIPHFRTTERVLEDALAFVDRHLNVIATGNPNAARQSIHRLLAELESFTHLKESFLRETNVVRTVGDRIRTHIRDHHGDYVERTGVFHEEEWQTLVQVFEEDDLGLDRRFTEWINETYRHERQMAADNQPAGKIRQYVKVRLLDDFMLRILELEMRDRSLRKGISRVILFPTHHESKNRAIVLTQGIDNPKFWNAMMVTETATLSRWVYSLMARMSLFAKSAKVAFRFRHHANLERPPRNLDDLTNDQRESLDHVVTELLANAIKYRKRSPDAANKVKVTVVETDRGVEIKVRDRGVGIHDVSAIWQPDVRERPELAEGYGGGLPSVMAHVAKHGWLIDVKSEPEKYTVFRLMIPIRSSTLPPADEDPKKS